MRLLTLIVLIYLLCACSENEHSAIASKQAESDAAKVSSQVAKAKALNITQFSKVHIGVSLLGLSFSEFLSHFDYDRAEVFEGQLYAYKNGKLILALSDKNELKDKVVWQVEVFSPNLISEKGIHVGMPITELVKEFRSLELQMSHEDNSEFFEPAELQELKKEFPDAAILINVGSKNGTPLGSGNLWEYPTKQFKTEGVISSIYIFKTGLLEPAQTHNQKSK
jgi:hypothetical protein